MPIKELFVGTIAHEQLTLLTDYDTTSQYTLAYQNLFANIRFDWDQEKWKQQTITIVAPATYAGQAAVASNIAIAAAQNGVPTVLVDADLHTPSLQQRFGIQEQQGLSELLAGEAITPQSLSQSLNKTFISDLSLLGAGKLQHQSLEISRLLSARLSQVIDNLRGYMNTVETRPSLIVFHSPSLSSSMDASLISSLMDQTFLLIIKGQTKRTQAQMAQAQLERAHAKLAGVIMLDS
jgi:capsular exopolysaccharide synthesis family protein